jgi:hypothetical protein
LSFSDLPKLTTRELRDRGVFDRGVTTQFSFPGTDAFPTIRAKVGWNEVGRFLTLRFLAENDIQQQFAEQKVTAFCDSKAHESKWYFRCPVTGKTVSHLYLVGMQFQSRHQLGGRYKSQETSRRRRGPSVRLAKQARQLEAAMRSSRPNLSTRVGLLEGRLRPGVFDGSRTALGFALAQRDVPPSVASVAPWGADVRLAAWEDHPRIDLRVLAGADEILMGMHTVTFLCWPGSYLAEAYVCCDLRPPGPPVVGLVTWLDGARVYQRIELIVPPPGVRRRYMFRCPVTGKPVETLAFRNGRFASRLAQRLLHQSQIRVRKP